MPIYAGTYHTCNEYKQPGPVHMYAASCCVHTFGGGVDQTDILSLVLSRAAEGSLSGPDLEGSLSGPDREAHEIYPVLISRHMRAYSHQHVQQHERQMPIARARPGLVTPTLGT